MKIILEEFEKDILEKPKLEKTDFETLEHLFQSLGNTITNVVVEIEKLELRYKELYDNSPVLYRTVNSEGIIILCNIKYANRLGYTVKEVLGTSIFDHIPEDQHKHMKEVFEMWKKRGIVSNEEIWLKTRFGTKFPVLMNVINQYDSNGNLFGSNTVLQEISDVYNAKKAFEEKMRLDAKINELEKSDKLRHELLSIVKHEFRTPLVPVKGYCEMLLEEPNENLTTTQLEYLNGIFQGISKFENVVDKILDLHALETKVTLFQNEIIPVQDFMKSVCDDFSKKITQKGMAVIVPIVDKAEIKGDVQKLRDVFGYIITNAMEFTPKENGKIEIGATVNNSSVIFYVKNNGLEIPKQELQNIFKKFYQIDSSHTRTHQGMGLGLAISKEIIKQCGGEIWCESEPGSGTVFKFSMPLST